MAEEGGGADVVLSSVGMYRPSANFFSSKRARVNEVGEAAKTLASCGGPPVTGMLKLQRVTLTCGRGEPSSTANRLFPRALRGHVFR